MEISAIKKKMLNSLNVIQKPQRLTLVDVGFVCCFHTENTSRYSWCINNHHNESFRKRVCQGMKSIQ